MTSPRPLPLAGVTVVAVEQAVAAPFATRQLADLGARVIKIERPGEGDFARKYDQRVKGQASYFVWINRSKESLTLDLKHRPAQDVLAALLSRADVLVQNLAPGAAARIGLSFDAHQPCGAEANMAKHLAAKASWEAANVCLQTHGGFGFACEYDVERKFRETRLYQVAPISTNMIFSYVAEHVLGLPRSY